VETHLRIPGCIFHGRAPDIHAVITILFPVYPLRPTYFEMLPESNLSESRMTVQPALDTETLMDKGGEFPEGTWRGQYPEISVS
jgi:hypothetical protein